MKRQFSEIERVKIRLYGGDALNKKCSSCGRSLRNDPCERHDHTWTSILMATCPGNAEWQENGKDASDDYRYISPACREPTATQAVVLPQHRHRRHPYAGERPRWSGYCVIKDCGCQCHNNEPDDKASDMEEV